jgi:hypothetical protein
MSEPSQKPEPDKDSLWGWWYKSKKWQSELAKSVAYKSVDIPEDMGDINAPKTMISYNGINPLTLVLLGVLGLGGYYLYNQGQQKEAVSTESTDIQKVLEDKDYRIRFWHNGKEVPVERRGDKWVPKEETEAPADGGY